MKSAYYHFPVIDDYRKDFSIRKPKIEFGLRLGGHFPQKSACESPLVSIITIVRNGERTIEKTIQSVLGQSYKNIEYIIVDGESRDSTLNIVKKYEAKIAYCLSERDQGISDAFNKGIALSTGEIIGIINSDDWYAEDAVATIIDNYRNSGDCVYHGKIIYEGNSPAQPYIFSANDKKIFSKFSINHPTVFVPISIYKSVGLFSLDFKSAMDYEWLIRAKTQGTHFCYIDKVISHMSEGGISDTNWFSGYKEAFKARSLHRTNVLKNFYILLNMTTITVFRKFFERLGLDFIVRFYRKKFSAVKKYSEN